MTGPRYSQKQLEVIAEEARRRANPDAPPDVLSRILPQQLAVIQDPSNFKVCRCTRRAGKSYCACLYLIDTALRYPGSVSIFTALTRKSALDIIKKPLDETLLHFDIDYTPRIADAEWHFPNGSIIRVIGGDNSEQEQAKFRGSPAQLVVLDEAGSWKADLSAFVNNVLIHVIADRDGTILMLGTPNDKQEGLFFDLTSKDKAEVDGWKTFFWSWEDNRFNYKNVRKTHDKILENNPLLVETPGYKQEWLGQWTIGEGSLVYAYSTARNLKKTEDGLITLPSGSTYILGMDLGASPDPTTFILMGYSPHDPNLYILEEEGGNDLLTDEIVAIISRFEASYPISRYVIDAGGGGKQMALEIADRAKRPFEHAYKSPNYKPIAIQTMNSELLTGRIILQEHSTKRLQEEWRKLIWEDPKTKKKEHPKLPNHYADAALYAFRIARNYNHTPAVPPPPAHNTEAYLTNLMQNRANAIRDQKIMEQGELLPIRIKAPFDRY